MRGWAALYGALGAVFLVFGLLSVLLLIAGAPTELGWIGANFAIGLLLLGGAIATSLDTLGERLRSGESKRIGKYGTSAIAQTAILVAIVFAIGFLATRYHKRWDVSESKVHSLSDQTKKLLASMPQDIDVTAFYAKVEQSRARELLDRYQYVSDKVKVEYADPNSRPDLVERYHVDPEKIGEGMLFVKVGDESVSVEQPDEEKLTNAIVKLTKREHKKVYFVTGHNERAVEGKGADGKEGFQRAAEALRNENYKVETLVLATKGEVPSDADVVIIAGPTRPLLPEEHTALQHYLERGGALFAMVDPRAQTDLGTDLQRWGVTLGNDVIVDRVQGMFGQAMTPLAGVYAPHPITQDMREVTIFPTTRSLAVSKDGGAQLTEIVKTGENSWAERDLDQLFNKGIAELDEKVDLKGPVTIAVAGKPAVQTPAPPPPAAGQPAPPAPKEPRLVVFGDSDFATNQLLDAYRNKDLFVNSVNWLLGDVEAISIRPAKSRASRLSLSEEQFTEIRSLSLFVLPELIAVLGVWAWWSRRRAPGR
jgi:gliding motility-associatede transport system auxiliary component